MALERVAAIVCNDKIPGRLPAASVLSSLRPPPTCTAQPPPLSALRYFPLLTQILSEQSLTLLEQSVT